MRWDEASLSRADGDGTRVAPTRVTVLVDYPDGTQTKIELVGRLGGSRVRFGRDDPPAPELPLLLRHRPEVGERVRFDLGPVESWTMQTTGPVTGVRW